MDYQGASATLERASDLEKNPAGVVKRWILELKLADKRETEWRKKANEALKRYRQKEAKKHSFNILWSNTETLSPAVYNTPPKPDVRRRFKDADPMGKAASDVLSRSLTYGIDTTDFDAAIRACVLDMLLPGRSVARVRYVPSLTQVGVTEETHTEDTETHTDALGETGEGDSEELEWESAPIEHVQWDDFKHGPGKEWSEVRWISFDHRLTRDELEEWFPECGGMIPLDSADDDDVKKEQDESVKDAFKTALVHEIWDKAERKVIFIAPSYKERPCLTVDDPLNLQGFWPIPRPLKAIDDSSSTVPVTLYELYQEQAEELDRISTRINKIIDGLRLRGIYDPTLSELSEIMRTQDNEFIPAQNVTALLERGGLEAAIWTTDKIVTAGAQVLAELYNQREQCKQVIYEITGIADIIRGSTQASETATAQQIKDKWGSMRLKKMQAEVARFIRDLIRLQSEIIAEKFQPETLITMTGLKFPRLAEKQQAMMQYQMAVQQGQQVPPPPDVPAWEEIIQVLRDDKQRTFKIDVETDSTVAASIESDMQGLAQVLDGITKASQGLVPLVQMGAFPLEGMKEILLTITRRARMGNAVEDAIDKIQQPPPQPQEQDNSAQAEQVKQQGEMQRTQMAQQHEQAMEAARMQHEERIKAIEMQADAMVEQGKMEADADLKWRIAQLDAETKVIVATIAAKQKAEADQMAAQQQAQQSMMDAENEAAERETKAQEKAEGDEKYGQMQETINASLDAFRTAIERLSQPRSVVRGADGRIAGVQ